MALDPTPEDPGSGKRSEMLLFALSIVISIGALVFRRPDAFTMPWFYGEEGREFMADAYNEGWASIFHTANGYFHLYPRLIANLGLSVGVPVLNMAWVNLVAVLVIYLVVWWYTWTRFPGPRRARFFAVIAITLVPLGNEIWMNQTNLQWPMSLLILLILFGTPPSNGLGRWLDAFLLLLTCLTGPYVLILLPLVVWHTWKRWQAHDPERGRMAVNTAVMLAAAIASALSLSDYGTVQRTDGAFDPLNTGFANAAYLQLWYPLIGKGVQSTPRWLGASLLAFGMAALALFWRLARGHALTRLLLVAGLLQFTAVLISYRGLPEFLSPYSAGIRTFYLPVVMLAWAVIARLDWSKRGSMTLMSMLMAWWAAQTILFVGPQRFRDRPVEADLAPLTRGEAVVVPIDPSPWVMRLEPSE